VGDIINVKDIGAKGDGVTDGNCFLEMISSSPTEFKKAILIQFVACIDTSAIGAALEQATTSNLIYFPAGSYIITGK
jgi:hypothetical protein